MTLPFTTPLEIICDHPHAKVQGCRPNCSIVMNFFLVLEFFSSEFGAVPDRLTDRKRLIREHTVHKHKWAFIYHQESYTVCENCTLIREDQ